MSRRVKPAAGVVMDIDVRWGDMDAVGHVNNVLFFEYLESARIRYYERLEIQAHRHGPGNEGPGLVHTELSFHRQLHYPATVRVFANVVAVGRRSFKLVYRIVGRDTGILHAQGSSTNVWVDYTAEKALPLPRPMIERIRALERAPNLGRRPAPPRGAADTVENKTSSAVEPVGRARRRGPPGR